MDESASYGRRIFDVMKRIKKRGLITPPIQDVRQSEFMMLHSIMHVSCCADKKSSDGVTGVTTSELSTILRQTPSAVSQTVKSLEEKGLVFRSASPVDRRVGYVSLTTAAHQVLKEAEQRFAEKLDKVISVLGSEDTEQLVSLLEKLASALESVQHPEEDNPPDLQTNTPQPKG